MKVRKGQVYKFQACGWDRFDRHSNTPENGISRCEIQMGLRHELHVC
jgi:hypothetical protein